MPSKKLSAVGKTQTYLRKDSTVMCQEVTGVDRVIEVMRMMTVFLLIKRYI